MNAYRSLKAGDSHIIYDVEDKMFFLCDRRDGLTTIYTRLVADRYDYYMNHVLVGSSIMTKYNNALFNNKLINKDFI